MGKIKISESELKSLVKKVVVREFFERSPYPEDREFDSDSEPYEVDSDQGLDEATDMDRYEDVVFLQGDSADEALEILNNQGEDAAMDYLAQWHFPGEHMGSSELSHGSSDKTYERDGYIMSYNIPLNYIGLQYELSGMNESKNQDKKKVINETTILITFVDGTKKKTTVSSSDPQFIKNNFGAGNKFTVDGKEKPVESVTILTEASDFYGIRNQVAYPKGGNIGGPHKQPIKDKDFNPKIGVEKSKIGMFDIEWLDKQVERLFGMNNYSNTKRIFDWERNLNSLVAIINSFKQQRGSSAPNNIEWVVRQFKYGLNNFPKEFSIHFGIDRDSDKSILSFLEHGTDSFIGNYEKFKEIIGKGRPEGTLTHESKQKLYNIVENVVRKVMLEKQDNFKVLLGVITSQKGNEWRVKGDSNESFYVVRPMDGLLLQMPPEVNEIGANKYGYEQVKNTIENLINQKEGGLTESTDLKHYTLKVKHDNGKVNLKTTASSEKEAKEKIMKAEGCPESAIISCKEDSKVIKEGVGANIPKIEKYVNKINELISQAFDSEGDPIGVVDPTSTWEEPYVYEPIIYKNGILKIVTYSWYKPTEKSVDIIKSRDMEYEGIPTLQLISRMYKKALKNKDKETVNTDI